MFILLLQFFVFIINFSFFLNETFLLFFLFPLLLLLAEINFQNMFKNIINYIENIKLCSLVVTVVKYLVSIYFSKSLSDSFTP